MPTRREFLMQAATAGVAAAASVHTTKTAEGAARDREAPMLTYRIPNTDLTISRIAYGAGFLDFDWRSSDFIAKAVPAIHTAYESGITCFDMADVYGHGKSEAALGAVLRESPGLRGKIVIQTKCGLRISKNWAMGDPIDGVDLSRAHILRSVEGSLNRLGTDHVDILMLHSPDILVEPEEVARAFDDLHRAGKVRYFGVSNHGILQIEVLRKYVQQPLVANQIRLGLASYAPLVDSRYAGLGCIVDYCRLRDIQVQAYSPLRGGLLRPSADSSPQLKQVAQLLEELAKQKNTNPSAIALAWLLRHPAGIVPVIGTSKPHYIVENCAADRIVLDQEEWRALLRSAAGIQSEGAA